MLVEQFAGACCPLLVALARGAGAAEPCTIGLGLPCRPLPFGALSELSQIDGFPHDRPVIRQAGRAQRFRTCTNPRAAIRSIQLASAKFPVATKTGEVNLRCESGIFLCPAGPRGKIASRTSAALIYINAGPMRDSRKIERRTLHPGCVILSGRTRRSNSAAVTKPCATASSFNVVPLAWADLATFA